MCQERDSSNGDATGALHESLAPAAGPAEKVSSFSGGNPDPLSREAKERRGTLIAKINAGWSEEAERALFAVAEQFLAKP